ncbi:lipopolysaccharide core heptose(I) kinase RfaP, partial [Providencia rettgeri]
SLRVILQQEASLIAKAESKAAQIKERTIRKSL